MTEDATKPDAIEDTESLAAVTALKKKSLGWAYFLGILGIVATIGMAVAVIYYNDQLNELQHWGYLGAFIISILGGATIVIPVPMLAVVFALGSAMDQVWQVALVGLSAALGELIGALTIYITGHGAGRVIVENRHGKVQRAYEKLLGLMERKGPLVLFIVASVVNPFFYPAALAAGALRFGIWKYSIIVFAGKIIKCMTVVYAGYYGLKNIFRAIGVDI
jgi:membrane protein DedA with SNARE-associated domain